MPPGTLKALSYSVTLRVDLRARHRPGSRHRVADTTSCRGAVRAVTRKADWKQHPS